MLAGAVRDARALGLALADLKKTAGVVCAHAALPEEGAYVFSMHVPHNSTHEQMMHVIEFELENRVPIPPKQAVYDFDIVGTNSEEGEEQSLLLAAKP